MSKTGQTLCYDAGGTLISCTGTGQDGEYQKGVATSPRFTDNGDGTVRDNLTGLIWLKNANCFGQQNWATALVSANNLSGGNCSLNDISIEGNWRLPNLRELQSLIDYSQFGTALPSGHPFFNVQSDIYWSATTDASNTTFVWGVNFNHGYAVTHNKTDTNYVWPVRGEVTTPF